MNHEKSLHNLTSVDVVEAALIFRRSLGQGEATHLRGFFGREFIDEIMLHHHESDGRFRYEYPKVQFKVIDREARLIGFNEGAELVARIWTEVDQTKIGDEELTIVESKLSRRQAFIGESDQPLTYRFRTPWLGLNQENHAKYDRTSDPSARRQLLERALVGNCLSFAKGFQHHVQARIVADCRELQEIQTRFKGVPMIGFVGVMRVNFHIPDHAGVGKSVSRGFGTVESVPPRSNPGRSSC